MKSFPANKRSLFENSLFLKGGMKRVFRLRHRIERDLSSDTPFLSAVFAVGLFKNKEFELARRYANFAKGQLEGCEMLDQYLIEILE